MKIEGGRAYIDKQEVARRLIHAAIRATLRGECPITNQVVIGSAITLMREFAQANGGKPMVDFDKFIVPEHAKGFEAAMKSHYNFFKHANHDAEYHHDVSNLTELNDLSIVTAIGEYVSLFKTRSIHMSLYYIYAMVKFPDVLTLPEEFEKSDAFPLLEDLKDYDRDTMLSLLAEFVEQGLLDAEIATDTEQLVRNTSPAYHQGNPHRDMFKRKL